MKKLCLAVFFICIAGFGFAVQPDEVLDDPILEERARVISKDLRCLVCQNESIDDSDASLARDLRLLVRERLVAGDTNEEVLEFVVTRYGEFALLRPKNTGMNVVLWWSGPVMLVLALLMAIVYVRRRSVAGDAVEELSTEEQARLDEILKR